MTAPRVAIWFSPATTRMGPPCTASISCSLLLWICHPAQQGKRPASTAPLPLPAGIL
ncbi:MAG: hypothetical protein IPJ66_13675 [Bacteroidetes bacterium]|nr:hypothetical protein [Bacteroidota bacterium]